jgi:hypothetical protein
MPSPDTEALERILSLSPPHGLAKWPFVEVVATILKEEYGWGGHDIDYRPNDAHPSAENKQFQVEFVRSMQRLGCYLRWREMENRVIWDWNEGTHPYKLPADIGDIKKLTSDDAAAKFGNVYGSAQPKLWGYFHGKQMEGVIQDLNALPIGES